MSDFKKGKTYELTIDRISNNGNGIVELIEGGHINVGRVKCKKGDTVIVQYLGDGIAFCTEKEKRAGQYNVSKRGGMISRTTSSDRSSGSTVEFEGVDPKNKNKLLNNLR